MALAAKRARKGGRRRRNEEESAAKKPLPCCFCQLDLSNVSVARRQRHMEACLARLRPRSASDARKGNDSDDDFCEPRKVETVGSKRSRERRSSFGLGSFAYAPERPPGAPSGVDGGKNVERAQLVDDAASVPKSRPLKLSVTVAALPGMKTLKSREEKLLRDIHGVNVKIAKLEARRRTLTRSLNRNRRNQKQVGEQAMTVQEPHVVCGVPSEQAEAQVFSQPLAEKAASDRDSDAENCAPALAVDSVEIVDLSGDPAGDLSDPQDAQEGNGAAPVAGGPLEELQSPLRLLDRAGATSRGRRRSLWSVAAANAVVSPSVFVTSILEGRANAEGKGGPSDAEEDCTSRESSLDSEIEACLEMYAPAEAFDLTKALAAEGAPTCLRECFPRYEENVHFVQSQSRSALGGALLRIHQAVLEGKRAQDPFAVKRCLCLEYFARMVAAVMFPNVIKDDQGQSPSAAASPAKAECRMAAKGAPTNPAGSGYASAGSTGSSDTVQDTDIEGV